MKYKSFFTDHIFLVGIIAVAVLIRTCRYTAFAPAWDAAVYLQMGKYLFSNGHIGLIEPFRPLTWPLLLGAGFKLGLSPIIFGKFLELLFTIGNIILIYCIGLRSFDKTTGLMAALFFSFSPTYFYYGNNLYADIPAAFFGLLSVLLFIEEKYFLSGVLILLAFSTKFIYLITMAIMIVFSFGASLKNAPAKSIPPSILFIKGIMISSIFFLSLDFGLYHNILRPFIDARQIYGQVNFHWVRGVAVYIHQLFAIEGMVFIFAPLMVLGLIQRNISSRQMMITAIGIGILLGMGKLPIDIPRFLTACVPYLYLTSAYGFMLGYRSSLKPYIKYLLLGLLVYSLIWQICQVEQIYFPKNKLSIFQQYAIKHSRVIKGGLWVSEPSATVFSDLKVQELMYYPVFNTQKINELTNDLSRANYIFYDGNALVCRPINDKICAEAKKNLLRKIINNFELVFPGNISIFNNYGIFKRPGVGP